MNQQFLLKEYGKLSLFEQENMTAEERSWWLRRLEEERRKQSEKSGN
jgi:hypothetical protein